MSLNSEQLKKVVERLFQDENWQVISPEIQKDLLDDLYSDFGQNIIEHHVDEVLKAKKKRAPRKKKETQEANPE